MPTGDERTRKRAFGWLGEHLGAVIGLLRTRTAAQTGLVMSGTLASGTLRFVITLVLAKVLTEKDWGTLAAFIALMDVISVYCEGGLNATMVRFIAVRSEERPHETVLKCFGLKMAISLAVLAGALLLSPRCLHRMQIEAADAWLYPLAVSAGIFLSMNGFGAAVFQGLQRYGYFAVLSALVNTLRFAGLAAAFFLGWHTLNVLAGVFFAAPMFAALLASGTVLIALHRGRDAARSSVTIRALALFMVPLTLLQVVTISNVRLNSFMLIAMTSSETLANYELAYQVAFVFPLLSAALFRVLLPKVAAMKTHEELRTYRRNALRLYPAVLTVSIAGMILAPFLLRLLFDDKYAEAIPILRLTIFTFSIHVVTQPLTLIFYCLGRPSRITIIYAVQLVNLALLNLVFIPWGGGFGAAVAHALTTSGSVAAIIIWTGRLVRDDAPLESAGT